MADKVYIGCKLPFGLIIQVNGQSVTLKGTNASQLVGGYGLTEVDADLWEAWQRENASHEVLKSNAVFAQVTAAKATGEAKEKDEVTTGFEPLPKAADKETALPAERR